VKYRPPQTGPAALLAGVGGAQSGAAGGWGTLRAMALGVASFAGAAGGVSGAGLGGIGGGA
jgi:hypothetical protein